jgi:integrase
MEVEPSYWVKKSAHTKQRKVHKVPLTPPALALLDQLREKRKSNNPHIFPGQIVGAPISQIWAVWYAVRDRATMALWKRDNKIAKMLTELEAGLKRKPTVEECKAFAETQGVTLPIGLLDTRPYDLRHTFASVGAGGGLSLPIIGKLLGHTQARTTQRYAHLADDPLREAAQKITTVITSAGRSGADVVPLRGGRS